MVNTKPLGYYFGRDIFHFVTGSGIEYETGLSSDNENIRMFVVDPHYDSRFAGEHKVKFEEIVEGMSNTTGQNFVY